MAQVKTKIVVAGDFLDGSCWARRQAVAAFDGEGHVYKGGLPALKAAHERREARCASRASHGSGAA